MRGPAARVYLNIIARKSRRERLRPTGAYIRPRRALHESESHQDVRAKLRRRHRRRNPGRLRRPRERCPGDDEVLSHLLDALSKRAPRKPETGIFHPRPGKELNPRQDALNGMAEPPP